METMMTRTTVTTMCSVMVARPGDGASSRRNHDSQSGRPKGEIASATALIGLFDDGDRRSAHAE
jgi:hypothetical protein